MVACMLIWCPEAFEHSYGPQDDEAKTKLLPSHFISRGIRYDFCLL